MKWRVKVKFQSTHVLFTIFSNDSKLLQDENTFCKKVENKTISEEVTNNLQYSVINTQHNIIN